MYGNPAEQGIWKMKLSVFRLRLDRGGI